MTSIRPLPWSRPEYGANARLVYGSTNTQNTVTGVTAAYETVRNLELASGRFLTGEEVEAESQVVVLGSELATDLFGPEDPLGLSVRINAQPFQIVGVPAKATTLFQNTHNLKRLGIDANAQAQRVFVSKQIGRQL